MSSTGPKKKRRFKHGALVEIDAYDHWSMGGWNDVSVCEPLTIRAAGYVVKEDKNYVYLAGILNTDTEKGVGRIGGILKSAIIKRRHIKG